MTPTQHGPWTIQKSIPVYHNPWISVREDQVISPEGKPGIFGIVSLIDGISVLALDEEGYVYLTREFHYAAGEETIEVVSGGLHAQESPLECAQRELREELGIEAADWTDCGMIQGFTTLVTGKSYLFLARGLTFHAAEPEVGEFIQAIKIPFAEAIDMVMQGRIFQGPSCVLLLKAWKYLQK